MPHNLVLKQQECLIVLRENELPPEDEQWDAFLRILDQNWHLFEKLKVFVRTPGGGPTAAQQRRLREVLRQRPILVAVVTESIGVRFLVSTIALLNREIRAFAPAEVASAYAHLKLTIRERDTIEGILKELEPQVRRSG